MSEAWRVRKLSCDGGCIGREWSCELFELEYVAVNRFNEIIEESNKRNPKHLFSKRMEVIDGVVGICNWQFGIMLSIDKVHIT